MLPGLLKLFGRQRSILAGLKLTLSTGVPGSHLKRLLAGTSPFLGRAPALSIRMEKIMERKACPIVAVANQKGGVGKTTTAINLAQALALQDLKVLLVDLDPQGNATQGVGVRLESIQASIADLIRARTFPIESSVYQGDGLDLIPATPALARVEREMVGMTNSELRLAHRLNELRDRYSIIVIDTPPTFGPLMNSALNAASKLIVPVDSSYFALMGIKELMAEVEEIQRGFNPRLEVLGYLLTLSDPTNISNQTKETLVSNFGESVFETSIRRSVKLKEAPALGKTIFHHAPDSAGAKDYMSLGFEVMQ